MDDIKYDQHLILPVNCLLYKLRDTTFSPLQITPFQLRSHGSNPERISFVLSSHFHQLSVLLPTLNGEI